MAAEPIQLTSTAPAQSSSSGCACGHENSSEVVLDVREIPHAIRHAAIFGSLGAIATGFSIDLIADHNPLPLIAQLEQKTPGQFTVAYVESGPEVWRLRVTRQSAAS